MGDKVFREMIEKMRSYRRALIQHACVSMCPIMVNSCDPMEYRAHLDPLPMELPSKNTGKGCHFLLQGSSRPQGSNLRFLLSQADVLPLSSVEIQSNMTSFLIIRRG